MISCATDFSPASVQAVRTAARLAAKLDDDLEIVHAWHVPPSGFPELSYPTELLASMQKDAQRGLDAAVLEARGLGAARVTSRLLIGVPWLTIAHESEDPARKLLVVGTHGRTGMSRALLGSVAEKVVRHAQCSVLVVPPSATDEQFEHALCPVDFTDVSRAAMMTGAGLVRPRGRITLLHAVELPGVYPREAPPLDYALDADHRSREMLDTWMSDVRRAVDIPVATSSKIGRPGTEILATLDEDPTIDLVVMGSHGRTGIKRVLLGSVAEKVVRHARCAVLVARRR